MKPDTKPTPAPQMSTQQDLPPHVPSCVSTGEGVQVPTAPQLPLGHPAHKPLVPGEWEATPAPEQATPRTFKRFSQSNHGLIPCDNGAYMTVEDAERELAAKDAEIAQLSDQLRIVVDAESFRARKIERERDQLRARVAELEQDKARLADHAEEILGCYLLEKQIQGHPCPQNMVRCTQLQADIDAARTKGAT